MRKLHFPVLVLTITLALSSCSTDDDDPASITVGSASSSSPTETPASSATPSASAPSSSALPSNATIAAWINDAPQEIAEYPMRCETDGAHLSAYLDIPETPNESTPIGQYWAELWVSDGRADVLSLGVNYGVGSTTARAWSPAESTGTFAAEVSGDQYTIHGHFADNLDGTAGDSAKLVVTCP